MTANCAALAAMVAVMAASRAAAGPIQDNSFPVEEAYNQEARVMQHMQIVPGVAVPIALGPSRGERSLFLYLSVEHGY